MSITVAIPFFNSEEYLALSIQSVLNQTFKEFELLLLDDGSTDSSINIAKSFDDPRIRIISDGKNLGLPTRLNQITELAKYDLIARMDADDIIPDNRLKLQYDYMVKHLDKDLVTTGVAYINKEDYMGQSLPNPPEKLALSHMLASRHGICHASLLVRKTWYIRNQYDSSMTRIEDYELWLRAFLNNDLRIGYLHVVGYYYRSDNTLNKNKFITTYKGGFLVAKKLPLPFATKNIFKMKLIIKLLLVSCIFSLNLQRKYLSKLDKHSISKDEQNIFVNNLQNINKSLTAFNLKN